MRERHYVKELEAILNAAGESILTESDADLCEELRAESINPDTYAEDARQALLTGIKSHRQQSLLRATAVYEDSSGVPYRQLLNKLEEQVRRAELLSQLIRLSSSSLLIEELLEGVVSKSTEVLGDTAFVVLCSDTGRLTLEAASSTDRDRLVKMLMTTVNLGEQAIKSDLLSAVLRRREPVLISNLLQATLTADLRSIVERHGIMSLLAVPIQRKEAVLGAFISLSTESKMLTNDDVATASALADFTAVALENAGLFAELQRLSITDSLTGVYNTRFFHEALERETARADRYSTPLSLLMIDIDTFKLVNDTFGHVVGNKVLIQIAKTLEHTVRNTDFIFRCGGDEFGVVLPGTSAQGALRAAEKILGRVQSSEILKSLGSGTTTVSIGIAEYRRSSPSETLMADADHALLEAKRSGKNTVRIFSKDPQNSRH